MRFKLIKLQFESGLRYEVFGWNDLGETLRVLFWSESHETRWSVIVE